MNTHRPYRSLCMFCVMGRGVNSPHRRSDAHDDLEGLLHVSMDRGFLGEKESEEQVTLVLFIRERRRKMTWAMLVPRRERKFTGLRREQRSSLISFCTTELRTTNQRSRRGKGNCTSSSRRCQRESTSGREPFQRSHELHWSIRIGVKVPLDERILCWPVEFAATESVSDEQVRRFCTCLPNPQ